MGLWATTCNPLFVDRRLPLVGWNEQSGDIVDSSASDGVSGYCAGGLLGESGVYSSIGRKLRGRRCIDLADGVKWSKSGLTK